MITEIPTSNADRDRARLHRAIFNACQKIAPLWPLKHFVAVNPFVGFTDLSFGETCAQYQRVAKIDMLLPQHFYRQAIESGSISDHALEQACREAGDFPGQKFSVTDIRSSLMTPATRPGDNGVVATVAEVLDSMSQGDRVLSRVNFMIDEISKFCAAYFDDGQAIWMHPLRGMPIYQAWRKAALVDRNPEIMGIGHFRRNITTLPSDPVDAIAVVLADLGIPESAVEDYLHRALLDIGGWAAYARYLVWQGDLYNRHEEVMTDLLALRLSWGYGLFKAREDGAFRQAWADAMQRATKLSDNQKGVPAPDLGIRLVLQRAYELSYQQPLIEKLKRTLTASGNGRPDFQAAFCIDVRSEFLRRALESASEKIQTIGFAGFFGFAIEYVHIGHTHGGAQCPVLLKPAHVIHENVKGATTSEVQGILNLRQLRWRLIKAWKAFKLSAVSCFTYVEATGLLFAVKLLTDSLGLTRPVTHPHAQGLDAELAGRLGPALGQHHTDDSHAGIDLLRRVDMAAGALKGMSLTHNFARLVLLCGHGSTSVNNPHATGLDCGACGGHTGEANARVAALVLNDPDVRSALAGRNIHIPEDTVFLAGLHDTATDEVQIFDTDDLPATHINDLGQLQKVLRDAGHQARHSRNRIFEFSAPENVDKAITGRSKDWSQTRPEWGLAGNAAFIAAPRARTSGIDLGGRVFLHDYDAARDAGSGVLELIMTAPMVVASWINLQYFGSTTNPKTFGSGNKVLHNVVGQLGVLEGNAGDLRVGLPWQSVHDGRRFVHEALRLSVFIEAPEAEIDRIIARHKSARDLVENQWIHLYAIKPGTDIIRQYYSREDWRAVSF